MRINHYSTFLILIFPLQIIFAQDATNNELTNEPNKNIDISSNLSKPTMHPLYWSYLFGESFLIHNQNTDLKQEKSDGLGSVYLTFFVDFPLGEKRKQSLDWGFSLAPGIGIGNNMFDINRELTRNDFGKLEFEEINEDFTHSNFGMTHIDSQLDFRYITRSNSRKQSFSFEIGPKFGLLLLAQKAIYTTTNQEQIRITTTGVKNFKKHRYGVVGKIGFRKVWVSQKTNENYGLNFCLVGTYYPSPIFDTNHGIQANYFFAGIGVGLLLPNNLSSITP